MKRFIYLILGVIVFTAASCTNEWFPNSTVHGKCINDITGQPIENIRVQLIGGNPEYSYSSSSSSNQKPETYRTVYSDADGYYEIKFYYGNKAYWIAPNTNKYTWVYNNNGYQKLLVHHGDNEVNLKLK